MAYIPGWQCTITVDTQDVGVDCNVLSFERTRASLPKPVFGSAHRGELPGQSSGTMSLEGHVSDTNLAVLEAIVAKEGSVAYTIQIGTAAGTTDAGSYAGNYAITDFAITSDAEGEVDFTLSGNLDGAPVYTAPTP